MEAAKDMAAEESERWNARISPAVLLTNILLHDKNPHIKQLKVELRKRYNLAKQQEKANRESNYKKELEAAGLTPLPAPGTPGLPEPPMGG